MLRENHQVAGKASGNIVGRAAEMEKA